MRRSRLFFVAAALAAVLSATPATTQTADSAAATTSVLFLVRHAEALYPPPDDQPRDPPLNIMGQARAEALARLLETAGIDRIHSSDYRRTQETAAPLAAALGLTVESYDPRALAEFAELLLASPGRHVVLGHSNTTPALVEHLGGMPGAPIDERVEYDRLYVLVIGADGSVTTVVQRYGDPLPDDWEERAGQRR